MTERVLSARQLNRALMARQGLLDRHLGPITTALERVGGLQTQHSPSGYIGLWSRCAGVSRADLTQALQDRRVIHGTLMRVTIHMVSADDYWPMAIAVRRARREWWTRTWRRQLGDADVEGAAKLVRRWLADGPLRQPEIVKRLVAAGFHRDLIWGVPLWVDLVRVPPAGTWDRPRANVYGLATDWLPPVQVGEREGIALLVRRYLGGFGPATPAEVADWAGLPVADVRVALGDVAPRRFVNEAGKELFDLGDVPLPEADTPAPPRFIGTFDAILLANVRRAEILPEEYRPRIFNVRVPHSLNTFLVDGRVAGSWRRVNGGIELDPFGRLSASERRALNAEAERLAAFHVD